MRYYICPDLSYEFAARKVDLAYRADTEFACIFVCNT